MMNEKIGKKDQEVEVPGVIPEAGVIAKFLLANPEEFNLKDRQFINPQIFDSSLSKATFIECDIAGIIATYTHNSEKPFFIIKSSEDKIMGFEIENEVVLPFLETDFSEGEVLTPEARRRIIENGGRVGIIKRTNPRQIGRTDASEDVIVRKNEIEVIDEPENYPKREILWRVPEKKRKAFEKRLKEIALDVEKNGRKILTSGGKIKKLLEELEELVKQSVNFYAAFFPEGSMRQEVLRMSSDVAA